MHHLFVNVSIWLLILLHHCYCIRGSTSLMKRTPHTPNLVSSPDPLCHAPWCGGSGDETTPNPLLATGLQGYCAIGFMFTLHFVNKDPSEGGVKLICLDMA